MARGARARQEERKMKRWVWSVLLTAVMMALLAGTAARGLQKPRSAPERAGFFAFFVHNLMDTSFFYTGVTALALLASGEPHSGGRKLGGLPLKLFFGASAAVFACGLYEALRG